MVDRSAHACFARAKHERDIGSARRLDVVRSERLMQRHGDARYQAKGAARPTTAAPIGPGVECMETVVDFGERPRRPSEPTRCRRVDAFAASSVESVW